VATLRNGFVRGLTSGFTSGGDETVRVARWKARAASYPFLLAGLVILIVHGPLALGVALLVIGVVTMLYLRYHLGKQRAVNRRGSA
jgi:hypothetical protein